jgi:hypothetical protein
MVADGPKPGGASGCSETAVKRVWKLPIVETVASSFPPNSTLPWSTDEATVEVSSMIRETFCAGVGTEVVWADLTAAE